MEQEQVSSIPFTSAVSLTDMGISRVPKRYILPPCHRPTPNLSLHSPATLLVVDLASLHHPTQRSQTIKDIGVACSELGFLQVINHNIPPSLMDGAFESATDFFNLPVEEKMSLMSSDINKPVRYGTSLNHKTDQVHFWRDFLKHYSHPLPKWIDSWPSNPPNYKEKMGKYAQAVQKLASELMQAIFESLGLESEYKNDEVEEGMQVIAVNCYPQCPEPELALGMPPHSDYGCLTILLQNCEGLDVTDKKGNWISVPFIERALLVHVGDHLEILSNGRYKSVVHRATVNSKSRRLSVASLHCLAIEEKVGPAPELVDQQHPTAYRESSFKEFLEFLSANADLLNGRRFIETLKI